MSELAGDAGRRRVVLGAAAVVAGLMGVAKWRHRSEDRVVANRFWTLKFESPGGPGEDDLAASAFIGHPLLVNFWATWCPPCVGEMPLLSRFYTENKANGWQLLGLSVDQEAGRVRDFLARSPVTFPVAMAGDAHDSSDLMGQLGNAADGIPFTVLFDAAGALRQRKLGPLDADDLADWRASV